METPEEVEEATVAFSEMENHTVDLVLFSKPPGYSSMKLAPLYRGFQALSVSDPLDGGVEGLTSHVTCLTGFLFCRACRTSPVSTGRRSPISGNLLLATSHEAHHAQASHQHGVGFGFRHRRGRDRVGGIHCGGAEGVVAGGAQQVGAGGHVVERERVAGRGGQHAASGAEVHRHVAAGVGKHQAERAEDVVAAGKVQVAGHVRQAADRDLFEQRRERAAEVDGHVGVRSHGAAGSAGGQHGREGQFFHQMHGCFPGGWC